MKELNLILHCGGRETDLETVERVATPDPVGKWHPIPHLQVHRAVEKSVGNLGLRIVSQVHALAAKGDRYFGMYQLAVNENPEMGLVLATRNSHDKTFVAGVAAGDGVFACDNLSFWGEVVFGRKHTTHILRDLPTVCDRAVATLAERWNGAERRVEAYKGHGMDDARVHDFLIRSIDAGVIPTSTVPKVLTEWRNPSHGEFAGRTAWTLLNAYTEAFKGLGNPEVLIRRSQLLHGMLDSECSILSRN